MFLAENVNFTGSLIKHEFVLESELILKKSVISVNRTFRILRRFPLKLNWVNLFDAFLECQEYDEQRLRRERRKENKRKMVVSLCTLSGRS